MIYLSDHYLFMVLQIALAAAAVAAAARWYWPVVKERIWKRRSSGFDVSAQVVRGKESLQTFYGTCAAVLGVIIAIDLNVEFAKNYRIVWVVLDIVAVMYLCLINPIARNLLLRWPEYLKKLEKR